MRRAIALILLMIFLLTAGFVHAQDDAPPIVTATVIYPTVNVRWMPETYFHTFTDIDSRIGEVHAGDTLILYRWESVRYNDSNVWVYATHPQSGLTGWIRADSLNIESGRWQNTLPEIRNWAELGAFVAQTAPNGLQAVVYGGYGGYDRLNVRAEPYISAPKSGELPLGSTVTILGRALSNGFPLPYVYVRDNETGIEGWAVDSGLITIGEVARYNEALPTLYEVNPSIDTAGLPRIRLSNTILRDAPDPDARILYGYSILGATIPRDSARYAINGRSADAEWLKVTDISSGEVGWVAAALLTDSVLVIEDLPIVE